MNDEISSQIVTIDHQMPSESISIERPMEPLAPSNSLNQSEELTESFVHRTLSINSEIEHETMEKHYLSINGEPSSGFFIRRRSWNNIITPPDSLSHINSSTNFEIASESIPPVTNETNKNSQLSVNIEIPLHCLTRENSSIHSEQPAELENKDRDTALMEQMGYAQQSRRGFSGLMSFTFCFTVVSVFPSISIGLDFGLATGGSGIKLFYSNAASTHI